MNAKPYIHAFALISITALCLQLVSDFWLPLTLGVAATLLVAILTRR